MTTDQNQPQASMPDGQASQPGPSPSPQNQGQGGRRRRRRRKGKSGAQANGQGGQPDQQAHQNNNGNGQGHKQKAQKRFFQKNGNGQPQGNGGGGGGRRRNKQRRQQVFVGPMDHSYRAANGNIADSPPSTIEFRNGNLGNGNGYVGGEPLAMWEPPAAPIREDAPTHIYFFIEDLFFLAKIQETAKKLGIKVGFLKNEKDTLAKILEAPQEERPSLIVFDLNNANAKPLTLIPKLRAKLKKSTSIIGFLSHLQGDLKVKAVDAGCDMVMPRSAFSQNLPNLMRRHGFKDEEEKFEASPAY